MNKFYLFLLILFSTCLNSCTSLYLEEFDSPVHEGIKDYSLTDLERSIVEMPENQQDVLVVLPKMTQTTCLCSTSPFSASLNKVWICTQTDCEGNTIEGHYKVFNEGRINDIN